MSAKSQTPFTMPATTLATPSTLMPATISATMPRQHSASFCTRAFYVRGTVKQTAFAAVIAFVAVGVALLGSVSLANAQLGGPDFRAELSEATSLVGLKVARVQFRGNRKIEDDAIRLNLLSRAGGVLELAKVRQDIRAVWKMGFFEDVQVEGEKDANGEIVLTYVVKEKPSIRKVLISGNGDVELDDINEVLDLKRDAILDVTKVKRNRTKINDLYIEKGFYLASVDYEVRPANEAEVDIWFLIDERSKVEIREVNFIGNEHVPDDELRELVRTKKGGGALSFLGDDGVYNETKFETDLLLITAHYYDRGHLHLKLGNPGIRLSRDKRYMYLSIPIDEGPIFAIGEVDFKGELLDDDGKLLTDPGAIAKAKTSYTDRLLIKREDVFNRSKVGLDIERLNNFYKDKGFAYVNVTPVTNVDVDKKTVDLTFDIERGRKVYFERINVRGNSKTRDKVIRRELAVAEGEIYSESKIAVSKARITALGYFDRVDISTKRGSADEFIEVNVEVHERPTGTFQIGAGFSSVENFIAQAQISQNNLFGRGQTLALQATVSSLRQLFLVRFVEPYFLDTRATFAFDLFNQSRNFGQPGSTSGFSRNAAGGNLTWGYSLNYQTRAFLTYKLEKVGVSTGTSGFANIGAVTEPIQAQSVANLFRGGVTSSLRASVLRDTRDNRLFPRSGWYQNAFIEVADKATLSENVFIRYGGEARHYRPLFGPFVLKLKGELGVTSSRDPLGVPITERYLIGGIFDVRGFRPRSLGPILRVSQPGESGQPLGRLPLGGNMKLVFNSEIEFPLFEAVRISGVVFFDSGNAYNLEKRYCSESVQAGDVSPKIDPCFRLPESIVQGLRFSVGFGFRWFSPIGPLRFEWGIPLDRQPGEDSLVFEFTIGNSF